MVQRSQRGLLKGIHDMASIVWREISVKIKVFESLRSPVPSALARKRKLRPNPSSGLRKGVAEGTPKGISPSDRFREYRDEKLVHGRRNRSGLSGHGSTKTSAERTSLQGYRYSCGRLDGGVVRSLERGLKRSQYVPSCLRARTSSVCRQMQIRALQLTPNFELQCHVRPSPFL